ncbi:unnamed protein product [Bursaphelenchus xylophilus]|uniref:(pine wood nematode) hypothetical protein n=1 Tax=Bursaphelenchus xylophilus TaxID=6326 RepID=A0A1I7S0A1_BURXY|nr:unnamed protein product [Bursaphelenchus xylophilus]CAG9108933.1 unnamed protein product [Bursaphelenchus xylophilus]
MAFYTIALCRFEKFIEWFRVWIEIWHIWVVTIGALVIMLLVCIVALFTDSQHDDRFDKRVGRFFTAVSNSSISYAIFAFLALVFLFPFAIVILSLKVLGPYERKTTVREARIFSLF